VDGKVPYDGAEAPGQKQQILGLPAGHADQPNGMRPFAFGNKLEDCRNAACLRKTFSK